MSASLVGSEMCIRDRAVITLQPLTDSSDPERDILKALRTAERGGAPVSYTHLTLPTICSV
eukprot:3695079-Alexandrium_andersonii.AAC.1